LLTALFQAIAPWAETDTLLIDLEGHGREDLFEDVDLSRTVGWFTSQFPVRLSAPANGSLGEILKAVKEQLRAIPQRGIGYGVLRYLSHHAAALTTLPQPQLSFNYLGQFDPGFSANAGFQLAPESSGLLHSPEGHRSYLLEINGYVSGGQLHLEWTYSTDQYQRSTIEQLAQNCMDILRSLITSSESSAEIDYTPADFADFQWSQWDQADIDNILMAIDEA